MDSKSSLTRPQVSFIDIIDFTDSLTVSQPSAVSPMFFRISFFLFPLYFSAQRNLALGLVLGCWALGGLMRKNHGQQCQAAHWRRPLLHSFRLFQVRCYSKSLGSKGSVALQDGIPTLGSEAPKSFLSYQPPNDIRGSVGTPPHGL